MLSTRTRQGPTREVQYFNSWRLRWARRDFEEKQTSSASELEIDVATLRRYENGRVNPLSAQPRPEVLAFVHKLATVYGTDSDDPWLITRPKLLLRHHPRDLHLAEALAHSLAGTSCEPWFELWEARSSIGKDELMAQALHGAWAVLVCCGPCGVWHGWKTEPWWQPERRRRPVLVIRLPGCPADLDLGPLAADATVSVDGEDLDPLFREALLGPPEIGGPRNRLPFKGLVAFSSADARFFCGRRRDVDAILQQMQRSAFVAAIGAPGAGKSSLLNAGLIPAVLTGALGGDGTTWRVVEIHSWDDSAAALASRFDFLDDEASLERGTVQKTLATRLHDWFTAQPDARLLVVIDPLEGLLPSGRSSSGSTWLVDNLVSAARQDSLRGRFWVVAALRNDLLAELQSHFPDIGRLALSAAHSVTPICGNDLREVIEVPARIAGLTIENGLTERLLDDARGEANVLPLLQLTLALAADAARPAAALTHTAYDQVGGLRGALQRLCDDLPTHTPEDEILMRRILLRLVRLEPTSTTTVPRRHWARMNELTAISARMFELLLGARLLVVHKDISTGAEPLVELTHDLLVTSWDKLSRWIEDAKTALHMRTELTRKTEEWRRYGRSSNDLLRRAQIDRILIALRVDHPGWAARLRGRMVWDASLVPVADEERDLVAASLRRVAQRRVAFALGMFLAVSAVAIAVGLQQRSCAVVPGFGACKQSSQLMPSNVAFAAEPIPCMERCIGDARSALRVTADLPASGQRWALVSFERPFIDLGRRPSFGAASGVRIAVISRTGAVALEVKMVSDGASVVYFSCPVENGDRTQTLLVRGSDLQIRGVRMDRVNEIGIGFSRDARTSGGRHEIDILGVVDATATQDHAATPVPCTARDANPV